MFSKNKDLLSITKLHFKPKLVVWKLLKNRFNNIKTWNKSIQLHKLKLMWNVEARNYSNYLIKDYLKSINLQLKANIYNK